MTLEEVCKELGKDIEIIDEEKCGVCDSVLEDCDCEDGFALTKKH